VKTDVLFKAFLDIFDAAVGGPRENRIERRWKGDRSLHWTESL